MFPSQQFPQQQQQWQQHNFPSNEFPQQWVGPDYSGSRVGGGAFDIHSSRMRVNQHQAFLQQLAKSSPIPPTNYGVPTGTATAYPVTRPSPAVVAPVVRLPVAPAAANLFTAPNIVSASPSKADGGAVETPVTNGHTQIRHSVPRASFVLFECEASQMQSQTQRIETKARLHSLLLQYQEVRTVPVVIIAYNGNMTVTAQSHLQAGSDSDFVFDEVHLLSYFGLSNEPSLSARSHVEICPGSKADYEIVKGRDWLPNPAKRNASQWVNEYYKRLALAHTGTAAGTPPVSGSSVPSTKLVLPVLPVKTLDRTFAGVSDLIGVSGVRKGLNALIQIVA